VPLLPEYVEEINDDEVIFRNYQGQRFTYKQPRQAAAAACGSVDQEQPDIVPIEIAAKHSRRKAVGGRRKGTG